MDEGLISLYLAVEEALYEVMQEVRGEVLDGLLRDVRAGEELGGEEHLRGLLPLIPLRLAARSVVASAHLARDLGWSPEEVTALRALANRWLDDVRQVLGAILGTEVPDAFRRAFEDEEGDEPPPTSSRAD
jgi:hypothetical protein